MKFIGDELLDIRSESAKISVIHNQLSSLFHNMTLLCLFMLGLLEMFLLRKTTGIYD